jgi:hypothetical protein
LAALDAAKRASDQVRVATEERDKAIAAAFPTALVTFVESMSKNFEAALPSYVVFQASQCMLAHTLYHADDLLYCCICFVGWQCGGCFCRW